MYALTRVDAAMTAEDVGDNAANGQGNKYSAAEQFGPHDGARDWRICCSGEDGAKAHCGEELTISSKGQR